MYVLPIAFRVLIEILDKSKGHPVAIFQTPFFRSKTAKTEADYEIGVRLLHVSDYAGAIRYFEQAASNGHISALYNLFLILAGGNITPYNVDKAVIHWRKAADAGHPSARTTIEFLNSADRGGFGANNLATLAEQPYLASPLNPFVMICGARMYDVFCRHFDATDGVIAYELDAATNSEHRFVHSFVTRTGINRDMYKGGLNRIECGSPADQITDGLNNLHVGLLRAGITEERAIMVRCSIVGYVIEKSKYGARSQPLRGLDTFFD